MTPELVVGNTFMCVSVLQAGPCFRILYNSPNGEHGILRFDEYFKIKSIFVRPFLTLFGSSLYSVILRFGPQEKRSEGLAVGGREVGKIPQNVEAGGGPFQASSLGQDWGGRSEALLARLGRCCLEKEEALIRVPSWRPGSHTVPRKNARYSDTSRVPDSCEWRRDGERFWTASWRFLRPESF